MSLVPVDSSHEFDHLSKVHVSAFSPRPISRQLQDGSVLIIPVHPQSLYHIDFRKAEVTKPPQSLLIGLGQLKLQVNFGSEKVFDCEVQVVPVSLQRFDRLLLTEAHGDQRLDILIAYLDQVTTLLQVLETQ